MQRKGAKENDHTHIAAFNTFKAICNFLFNLSHFKKNCFCHRPNFHSNHLIRSCVILQFLSSSINSLFYSIGPNQVHRPPFFLFHFLSPKSISSLCVQFSQIHTILLQSLSQMLFTLYLSNCPHHCYKHPRLPLVVSWFCPFILCSSIHCMQLI